MRWHLDRENQQDAASLCRSGTTKVSSGKTSMVKVVHKAGVCSATRLQEEHTWQSKSGARLEQTDGRLDKGNVLGIRQNRKISANISTGRRWMDPLDAGRCSRCRAHGAGGILGSFAPLVMANWDRNFFFFCRMIRRNWNEKVVVGVKKVGNS